MEETKVGAENGREEEDDRRTGEEEARVNYTEKVIITKKKINNIKKETIIIITKTEIEIKIERTPKTPTLRTKQINPRSNSITIITINTLENVKSNIKKNSTRIIK